MSYVCELGFVYFATMLDPPNSCMAAPTTMANAGVLKLRKGSCRATPTACQTELRNPTCVTYTAMINSRIQVETRGGSVDSVLPPSNGCVPYRLEEDVAVCNLPSSTRPHRVWRSARCSTLIRHGDSVAKGRYHLLSEWMFALRLSSLSVAIASGPLPAVTT